MSDAERANQNHGDVVLATVDAGSAPAQWAMAQYFAELGERFAGGFDATGALAEAAVAYTPPSGRFVLAWGGDEPVACGGVVFVDDATAELKRMWVSPRCRGIGLGRRLLARLQREAVSAGRHRVILDTNGALVEAIALYERSGYTRIGRYNDNPYAQHWFAKQLLPG